MCPPPACSSMRLLSHILHPKTRVRGRVFNRFGSHNSVGSGAGFIAKGAYWPSFLGRALRIPLSHKSYQMAATNKAPRPDNVKPLARF